MRLPAALLLVMLPAAVHAQTDALTRLEIDSTGSAQAVPDQLEATLVAQQSGPDAALVQQAVNNAMGAALKLAKTVPDLQPSLLGYETTQDEHRTWTATSRMSLRSTDSVRLLDLVGKLQAGGLVLDGLVWQLSPALHDREQTEATRAALLGLVHRAGDAAAALNLRVDHLAEVRVSDAGGFQPRPFGARALTAIPPAPTAPLSVDVTASATVLLHP